MRVEFEKNGKLWERINDRCDRCGGHGIFAVGVHNGHLVPAQPDAGVCYKCHGTGTMVIERRVYTDKEKATIERAKARAEVKRAEKRKADEGKRIADTNYRLKQFNFFGQDTIYVVDIENTYTIKDSLREEGAKWLGQIGRWCFASETEEYPTFPLQFTDVTETNEYGIMEFRKNAKEIVTGMLSNVVTKEPKPVSMHVGTIGEKIELTATVTRCSSIASEWGGTNIYTLIDAQGQIYTWFTGTDKFELLKTYSMVATVKDHNEYKDEKQTVITRPSKIKLVE